MEGGFTKIFKQAYQLTKGYKFFWLMGLFLVWLNFFKSFILMFEFGSRMKIADLENVTLSAEPTRANPWVGLISLIFIALGVIYYFRSKGALIVATKQLHSHKEIDTNMVYEESEPHTIQLMKVGFSLAAILLIITAILLSPVLYLTSTEYSSSKAEALGLFAFVIYVPIFAVIYFTTIFAPIFIVLNRMTIYNSVRASLDIIVKRWPILVLFSLAMLGIEIAALALTLGLVGLSLAPFVLLSDIFYYMGGQTALIALQALAGIVVFVVFLFLQGLVAAFQRIAWTIMFFETVKPVKTEAPAEAESLPEVIS